MQYDSVNWKNKATTKAFSGLGDYSFGKKAVRSNGIRRIMVRSEDELLHVEGSFCVDV